MSESVPKILSEKVINNNIYNLPKEFEDKVYCMSYHSEGYWTEVEISSDLFVYPCCTLHGIHQREKMFDDPYLDSLGENWNNLRNNNLKDILKIFYNYIIPEKWKKSETLPDCCRRCRIEI